jgi:hypothetical protein
LPGTVPYEHSLHCNDKGANASVCLATREDLLVVEWVLAKLIDKASEEITTSLVGNMDGTSDDEAAAKRQKAREKDKRYRVRKGPDKEWRESRCESSRLHKEQNRAAIQKRDREQKQRKKLLASQSVPSVEVEIEDAAEESPALLAPPALNIRNEPPSSANESAESRAAGEIVCGAPFADEMDVDSVAEPGSNEEHTGNEDHTVPEEGGPGGSGDDEDDDGGGALPFDDDGGGVAPMVDAGGDDGEGPPTVTEGATGSATGPEGSPTGGASVPRSSPPYAMNGAASISILEADSARGPTDGEDSSRSRSDRDSDQPTVSQVELAVLRGVNRVHVQEKKDLHDKLVEALVSNALLQKRVLVLEQQQQQQRDGAVQALPTDGMTQARDEVPDGPSRRADADRLRQLEAANSKLEEDLRELEKLDREREAATEAQMKQHLEAYEKLRGDFKAEKQAREKDVGDFQRQLNERGDRHTTELVSLKRKHEAELGAQQKMIQDHEQLIKKYKRENEELKKQGASVKAEPGRDPQPDRQRSSRVSVKEEPGRDPQPDQPRSSRVSVKTEPGSDPQPEQERSSRVSVKEEPGRGPPPDQPRSSSISVKAEPGCDLQPDQPRSSNDVSSSSAPRSNTKVEKGAAGTGKK